MKQNLNKKFKKEKQIYYSKLFNFFIKGFGSGQKSSGSATLVLLMKSTYIHYIVMINL